MADRVTILLLSILAAQCCVPAATQQCGLDPVLPALAHSTYLSYLAHVAALKEKLRITNQLIACTVGAANACIKEEPMGMEDGRIPDSSLTASSMFDDRFGPEKARLKSPDKPGSWSAGRGDFYPWIQVDFTKKVHMSGVVTQGRGDADQWVREYQVAFSQDGSTMTKVADAEGAAIKFTGNTDSDTEVTNRFPAVVSARYLRIYPTELHTYRSLRFEVIGCAHTSTQS